MGFYVRPQAAEARRGNRGFQLPPNSGQVRLDQFLVDDQAGARQAPEPVELVEVLIKRVASLHHAAKIALPTDSQAGKRGCEGSAPVYREPGVLFAAAGRPISERLLFFFAGGQLLFPRRQGLPAVAF